MRLLLLDTNLAALPIYNWLKECGHEVFVAGTNPNDTLALYNESYLNFDYSDIDIIDNFVKEKEIDFVLPGCNDISYAIASAYAKKINSILNISPPEINKIFVDKNEFKTFALANKLKVPAIIQHNQLDDAHYSKIIIKPVDAYSGRGITVLDSTQFENLDTAIQFAQQFSKSKNYIIEEFVEGTLYSHSAFIKNLSVCQDFIVEEHCIDTPYAVDNSWLIDNNSFPLINEVREEINKIAQCLNLSDGLIHTQFISNGDKFWIIEITRRCPGDLYSFLIEYSTGFPYAESYISSILNKGEIHGTTIGRKKILRKTMSFASSGSWISLKYNHPVFKFSEFFPLEKSGTTMKSGTKGRGGILFLEYDEADKEITFESVVN